MPAKLGRVMQPAITNGRAAGVRAAVQDVGKSFGADPGIVNKTFVLNGESRTLIGLCPQIWMGRCGYVDSGEAQPGGGGRTVAGAFQQRWWMLGHLRPGITVKEAEADLQWWLSGSRRCTRRNTRNGLRAERVADEFVVGDSDTLYIVLAAVGCCC